MFGFSAIQLFVAALVPGLGLAGAVAGVRLLRAKGVRASDLVPDVVGDLNAEDVGAATERAKRGVIGEPDKIPRRALIAVVLASLALSLAGAFMAARGMVSTGTSSLPFLRPVLKFTTSVWVYVGLLAWLSRRVLWYLDERKAEQAADVTGYEPRSVRRLAYESKDADGSTRVIVTSDDDPEDIRGRILEALETGEDDTLSLNPEAFEDETPGGLDGRKDELWSEYDDLEERAEDLKDDLDAGVDDVLDNDATLVDENILEQERVSLLDLMGGSAEDRLDGLEDTEQEFESVLDRMQEILEELEVLDDYSGERLAGRLLAAEGNAFALADELDAAAPAVEGETEADEVSDAWREKFKLFRLDLATTLDVSEVLWQLALPAALTVGILLLAVEIWVSPVLYPPIMAAGLLVGVLNYLRVSFKRSRRLESLREERDGVNWSDLSVLVKEVEVPETRMYYGRMAERKYAHENRSEFADELAHRAYELVNGVPVSPSIMEKQATQIDRMHPDLHGFRDDEKYRIGMWLLNRVENARHGLMPKPKLIEDCVEHDIVERRFAPGQRGKGFDPELVREAYRELVPAALVEQEIEPPESSEDAQPVTAVRLRSDTLPPEYGQIRAAFTSQFQNYSRWTPLYDLPDVSDRLEDEPAFADTIGYRGGES